MPTTDALRFPIEMSFDTVKAVAFRWCNLEARAPLNVKRLQFDTFVLGGCKSEFRPSSLSLVRSINPEDYFSPPPLSEFFKVRLRSSQTPQGHTNHTTCSHSRWLGNSHERVLWSRLDSNTDGGKIRDIRWRLKGMRCKDTFKCENSSKCPNRQIENIKK